MRTNREKQFTGNRPLVSGIALLVAGCLSATLPVADAAPAITPSELAAPKIAIAGDKVVLTVFPTVSGRRYQAQRSDTMANGSWVNVGGGFVGNGGALVIPIAHDPGVGMRFYRLVLDPSEFVFISTGYFQMGDQSSPLQGSCNERPVHTVYASAFYIAKYEVTKELWDGVRAWGLNNGYTDLAVGNGSYASKGVNHPVHSISWHDMVKWCNARSQREGLSLCYIGSRGYYKTGQDPAVVCNWSANGYRLPTEAEWEKAARGGEVGKNFPWSADTITHSQANYYSSSLFIYDVSPTRECHPTYAVGEVPFSSPVGCFAPNGYGLYDMAGNLGEGCWDWYGSYTPGAQFDPRGPYSGSYRVARGGGWGDCVLLCRIACRCYFSPGNSGYDLGFRLARSSVP
jgi:formylglycine-generating enzyme required for sulfatase activity